jgi:hypothetical protein
MMGHPRFIAPLAKPQSFKTVISRNRWLVADDSGLLTSNAMSGNLESKQRQACLVGCATAKAMRAKIVPQLPTNGPM